MTSAPLPQQHNQPRRLGGLSLLVLTLLTVAVPVAPAAAQSELDTFIAQRMATARVPGLTAAVVRDSTVVWTGQYGFRNTDTQQPVLPETPFLLASVSKIVTATALMHLYDTGAFQLDEAIDAHVPFTVRNPGSPATPITFRQLLMHIGSIDDNWSVLEPLVVDGDSPIALNDVLFDYLDPNGALYDPSDNYRNSSPGASYFYTNVGFALVGYLVEAISGQPFDEYSQNHLFGPLGMDDTGWFLADFPNVSAIAKPHEHEGAGTYSTVPHYGFPDYPNGQLRSSAIDMAAFMMMHLGDGQWNGQRVLKASTAQLMRQITLPALAQDQGLGFYWDRASGRDVVGHNGGEVGAYADLFFDPTTGAGVMLVANGDPVNPNAMWAIVERLFDEAPDFTGPIFADGFETGDITAWSSSVSF